MRALAWLYEESPDIRDEVALHRVERGAAATTRYGVEEIATAARQHIELR